RPVALPLVDLSGLDADGRETAARLLLQREAACPFDLRRWPLLRLLLLRMSAKDHVLSVNEHHIVTDGWSTGILVREFMALYEAHHAGRPSPLPELAIQYTDYASWQRDWLQGEVLDRELNYWRTQLAELEQLDLPTDRPRLLAGTHPAGVVSFGLSERLTGFLLQLGREAGATLFMVVLAAWKILLSRYSGQDDFAVGTAIANRHRLETEGRIGLFFKTLVMG